LDGGQFHVELLPASSSRTAFNRIGNSEGRQKAAGAAAFNEPPRT
jgi:hypothetical protein